MDPLSHMLAGAVVFDCLPMVNATGKRGLAAAMVAAAAPDLDVVPALVAAFPTNPFSREGLFDPDLLLRLHRGYTHALPILLIAAVLFGPLLWRSLGRRGTWCGWSLVVLTAFLTHILLDMVNGSVRLWLPFSERWIGWGQFPEADPFLIAVLLVPFLANHPFHFENRHHLGTLTALERIGAWLHARLTARVGARRLALLCLVLATLRILVNVWKLI